MSSLIMDEIKKKKNIYIYIYLRATHISVKTMRKSRKMFAIRTG